MTSEDRRAALYDFMSMLTSFEHSEQVRNFLLAKIHDGADEPGRLAMRWASLALALIGDACMQDDPSIPAFDFEADETYSEAARAQLLEFLAAIAMIPPE